jgi:hypothetical protein
MYHHNKLIIGCFAKLNQYYGECNIFSNNLITIAKKHFNVDFLCSSRAMDSVERKLIKEVLNADQDAIAEIIEAHPNRVNFVSQCGESPMAIAVYKRDIGMINLLLQAGAHPNHVNNNGDTAFHSAARIGNIEILKIMYETRLCNLVIMNNNNQLAIDIADEMPTDADVNLLHLFGEWNGSIQLESELQELVVGRRLCFSYLYEKAVEDDTQQRQSDIDVMINLNADEQRLRRVLKDEQAYVHAAHFHVPIVIPHPPMSTIAQHDSAVVTAESEHPSVLINNNFHHCLVPNAYNNSVAWTHGQVGRYESNISDKILVTRGIFVKNFVNRLVCNEVDKWTGTGPK